MVAVSAVTSFMPNVTTALSVLPGQSGTQRVAGIPVATNRNLFAVMPDQGVVNTSIAGLRAERFSAKHPFGEWRARESTLPASLEEALDGHVDSSHLSCVLRTFIFTHFGGSLRKLARSAALHDSTIRGMLDPRHVHVSWRPAVKRVAERFGAGDGKGLVMSWAASVLAKEVEARKASGFAHPDLERGWRLMRLAEIISGKAMPEVPRDPFSIDYSSARHAFLRDALGVDEVVSRTFGRVIVAESEIFRVLGSDWHDVMSAWEQAEKYEQNAAPQRAIRAWCDVTQQLAVALSRAEEPWLVRHIRGLYEAAREKALELATPGFPVESPVNILGIQPFWLPPADQLVFKNAWLGLREDRRHRLAEVPRRILHAIEIALLGGEVYAVALSPMVLGLALRKLV